VILGTIIGGLVAVVLAASLRRRRAQRVWLHAFLEQQRREDNHDVPYRGDQRVRAIQQRLARKWGDKALTDKMRRRIEVALGLVKQQQ
jgi:hypothetical protein